jgi:hypothetical protein
LHIVAAICQGLPESQSLTGACSLVSDLIFQVGRRRADIVASAVSLSVADLPRPANALPLAGHSGLKEHQFNSLRARFPGVDIGEMERQFVQWNAEKGGEPENYTAALFGFIRAKVKRDKP